MAGSLQAPGGGVVLSKATSSWAQGSCRVPALKRAARVLSCVLKWDALATDTACEGVLPPPQRGSNGRAVAHPAGRSPRRVFPHSHVVILHDLVAPRSCADLCTAAGKGWAYLHGSGPYPSRLAAPPVCPCLQGVHGNPSAARCQGCVRPRPCAALPLSSCVARLLPREDTTRHVRGCVSSSEEASLW
jgi:hypothetical protein